MGKGKLTFFCGKMAAGKSTKSQQLVLKDRSILISEDEWLASLYPNQVKSLEDYVVYSNRIKPQVKQLVQSVLSAGVNVVMDFPANTVLQRKWFRSIISEIDAPHELFYIESSDENCLTQLASRRLQHPERAATDTREMFEQMKTYFVEPQPSEEFNVIHEY